MIHYLKGISLKTLKKFKQSKYFNTFCYVWTAFFGTLAFAPYSLSLFAVLSPFGLFWFEEKYSKQYKIIFKKGFYFSFFFCLFSYYWIMYMLNEFGGFPYIIAFPLFLLYCFIVNWKFPVFIALFGFLKRKVGKRNFLLPAFCILVAEFGTYQIFPWYYGNLLASNIILAQSIEYFSVYGLSALTLILSYALFSFPYKNFSKQDYTYKKKVLWVYSIPVYILISFFSLGYFLFLKWDSITPIKTKQVLMIQPDAPLEFRDGRSVREAMEDLMFRIERLVLDGSEKIKPDLIVLPESAVPFFSAHNTDATTLFENVYWYRYEALIFQLTNRLKTNFYFNEIDASYKSNIGDKKNLRYHNNSVIFDPNGDRKENYYKSYLLAFGEYIPLGEIFPVLYSIVPQIGRFIPGEEQNFITYYKNKNEVKFGKAHLKWADSSYMNMAQTKEYYKENKTEVIPDGKFLPLTCYEVIIPEFVRKFYKNDMPEFIVNTTNDKWYGPTVETAEHLDLARIRSIEYRRWMVRSTMSGSSAFVDHLGRIVDDKKTEYLTVAHYGREVSVIDSGPTFYLKYGNLLIWIFLILFLIYIPIKIKFL